MPSKPPPQISDAEWEVMKVIWDASVHPAGSLTAGEVVGRLEAGGTRWKPRTIKTLLARLVQKGAVRAEPGADAAGRTFRYRAAVSRDACARSESRWFLSRVFDGAVAPALLHFLQSAKLSQEEIRQLKDLLDREAAAGAGTESDRSRSPGKERKS
jgi:BlaI family penicillinase repressor